MFNLEHGALKIWSAQGEISGLVVNDILIDSPTFSGLQLDGGYPITGARFENIEITDAGTDGIFLSSRLSGDVSFSFITVSNSQDHALLNYSPKLKFSFHFGEGNVGWQFP